MNASIKRQSIMQSIKSILYPLLSTRRSTSSSSSSGSSAKEIYHHHRLIGNRHAKSFHILAQLHKGTDTHFKQPFSKRSRKKIKGREHANCFNSRIIMSLTKDTPHPQRKRSSRIKCWGKGKGKNFFWYFAFRLGFWKCHLSFGKDGRQRGKKVIFQEKDYI